MSFNYSPIISTARSLISDFGRPFEMVKMSSKSTDIDKPWKYVQSTEKKISVTGVFYDSNITESEGVQLSLGDKFVVISTDEYVDDFTYIIDGGKQWDIVSISRVQPGSSNILYVLQVRR